MSLLKYYTDLCPHEPEWVPTQLAEEAAAWQAEIKRLTDERDAERDRMRDALIRLRDCDWVITPANRMDAVRDIAREALT